MPTYDSTLYGVATSKKCCGGLLFIYARERGVNVTGINKTTDAVTLTYDPWGRARLDDAVGELECQGRRMVADREGVGADN